MYILKRKNIIDQHSLPKKFLEYSVDKIFEIYVNNDQ